MKFRLAGWWFIAAVAIGQSSRAEEFIWQASGPGLAMTRVTNSGPVIFTVVRVELARLNKDLLLTTTLASNTVVGLDTLANQAAALGKELGTPVAAINGDFYLTTGRAKGEPRGLHIWNGELVSVATGPAAFWQDLRGRLQAEAIASRLTISWPGGGTNLAGLNEQLHTNALVLFTPRMGTLYEYRPPTNRTARVTSGSRSSGASPEFPVGGMIRPAGGREYILEHTGAGPWLPLRIGHTYEARVVGSTDGFTNVPPGKLLISLGSNLVARVPNLTNGIPVTITVATEPDLAGVQSAMGTGPLLVRNGKAYEVVARQSEQNHPRSALGWNNDHLFLAVADGRQPSSVGIHLSEMADFLVRLGCLEALNLDGGVSTTLMLNGKTINSPSNAPRSSTLRQSYQREIKNAIVILRRNMLTDENVD